MGFYDEEKTALQYIAMADGYDGRTLIDIMSKHVPEGASVLELGMGPGTDVDLLARRYRVTGSDNSSFFLDRYRQINPSADLLELDAVSLETDRQFDCIYSNKVLHHLSAKDLSSSLHRQAALLGPGGYVMHSFWRGDGSEEKFGLSFHYHSEASIRYVFENHFEVVKLATYEELEADDSIYVLARALPSSQRP